MLTYNLIKNNLDLSKKIYIAFSGGPDSTALLHLISKMKTDFEIEPQAIHINHNLSNQSGKWTEHCKNICMSLDIDLLTESIEIRSKGGGIESAARQSRYKIFTNINTIYNDISIEKDEYTGKNKNLNLVNLGWKTCDRFDNSISKDYNKFLLICGHSTYRQLDLV